MRSLETAREVCESFHPGLLAELARLPFAEREAPDSPIVEIYRKYAGPGLLVPPAYGGLAANPLQASRVQRALGAASPSLAVGTVMHHFTVAMLFTLARDTDRLSAAQLRLLSSVAADGLLMASGWAEGRTDQNILAPAVVATRTAAGYLVDGAKKPCSLSRSMDVLTASAMVTDEAGRSALALLLIPADSPGITVEPFWANPVLAAAQSHEVRLEGVAVPEDLVITSTFADQDRLDDLQTAGFTWFELLTTASYVGAASALVERVLSGNRGSAVDRAALALRMEAVVDLVEGAARGVSADLEGDAAVAAVLVARYAAQEQLGRVVDEAVELLGGMAFIGAPEVTYLATAVRALAFHPPSRSSVAVEVAGYLAGGELSLS
jgi:alkylation response protein AidB-like acyl-CoA dehydrogenase